MSKDAILFKPSPRSDFYLDARHFYSLKNNTAYLTNDLDFLKKINKTGLRSDIKEKLYQSYLFFSEYEKIESHCFSEFSLGIFVRDLIASFSIKNDDDFSSDFYELVRTYSSVIADTIFLRHFGKLEDYNSKLTLVDSKTDEFLKKYPEISRETLVDIISCFFSFINNYHNYSIIYSKFSSSIECLFSDTYAKRNNIDNFKASTKNVLTRIFTLIGLKNIKGSITFEDFLSAFPPQIIWPKSFLNQIKFNCDNLIKENREVVLFDSGSLLISNKVFNRIPLISFSKYNELILISKNFIYKSSEQNITIEKLDSTELTGSKTKTIEFSNFTIKIFVSIQIEIGNLKNLYTKLNYLSNKPTFIDNIYSTQSLKIYNNLLNNFNFNKIKEQINSVSVLFESNLFYDKNNSFDFSINKNIDTIAFDFLKENININLKSIAIKETIINAKLFLYLQKYLFLFLESKKQKEFPKKYDLVQLIKRDKHVDSIQLNKNYLLKKIIRFENAGIYKAVLIDLSKTEYLVDYNNLKLIKDNENEKASYSSIIKASESSSSKKISELKERFNITIPAARGQEIDLGRIEINENNFAPPGF